MIPRGLNGECCHHWVIDQDNVGTCRYCGEVRQFRPWECLPSIVIKEGNGAKGGDMAWPSKFTKEERKAIMVEAIVRGTTVVAKERGLSTSTISTWIHTEKRRCNREAGKKASISIAEGKIRGPGEVAVRLEAMISLSKSDMFKDGRAPGYIEALQWVLGVSD